MAVSDQSHEYRHLRRNFFLFLWDYVAFGVAFSLIGTSGTVVPSFLSQLTDSKAIIGLAGGLYTFCWLVPQLFFAQIVNRTQRRHKFMAPAVYFRLVLVAVAMLVAANGTQNPSLTLTFFLFGYWFFAAGDSVVTLAWGDILGGSIPPKARSLMFGLGQFSVGIGAIAMRELTRWALGPTGPGFPNSYALLFGVASVFFISGGIALALIREENVHLVATDAGPSGREFVPYLGNVLRTDKSFQRFIRTRLLFDLSRMAVPFYVIFGISVLGLSRQDLVGDSILVIELGNASAGLLMAWLSRRSGSRAVIVLAGVFVISELSLALISYLGGGQIALYAVFAMLGCFMATATPSYFDWMITHAPRHVRPIYIGLTNTIAAVSNLAPFLGGTLLTLTAIPIASPKLMPGGFKLAHATLTQYPVVFVAALVLAVLGLLSALTLDEPRRKEAA